MGEIIYSCYFVKKAHLIGTLQAQSDSGCCATPSLLFWRGLGDPASHCALHPSLQSTCAGSSSQVESERHEVAVQGWVVSCFCLQFDMFE